MTENQEIKTKAMDMSLKLSELLFKQLELRDEKPLTREESPKEVREDPDMWASYFPLKYSSLEEHAKWFEEFIRG